MIQANSNRRLMILSEADSCLRENIHMSEGDHSFSTGDMNDNNSKRANMNNTIALLELAERTANQRSDGRLTVMRFTVQGKSVWKACFGIPGLNEIDQLVDYESAEDCLFHLLFDASQCGDRNG